MLVANKVDDPRATDFYEFYTLGVGEVFPVSAINGKGSGDMLDARHRATSRAPSRDEEARCASR